MFQTYRLSFFFIVDFSIRLKLGRFSRTRMRGNYNFFVYTNVCTNFSAKSRGLRSFLSVLGEKVIWSNHISQFRADFAVTEF